MPPKAASKGGKRGRPPNASKTENASRAQAPGEPELPQDLNDELSFEDQSTPKNGLVPPAKAAEEAVGGRRTRGRLSPAQPDSEPTPRRAGRASNPPEGGARDDELADQTTDTPASASRGQRRKGRVAGGMDSMTGEDVTSQTEDASTAAANPKRKRGRPPKAAQTEPAGDSTTMDTTEPMQKRKRGRPSLQSRAAEGTPLNESATRGNKGKRKASAIEQDDAADDETAPAAKKPRGRRPKSAVPAESTPEPRRRGRPRTSEASASKTTQNPSSSTKASKTKAPPASAESQKKRRRTDAQPAPARNTLAGPPPPEPAEEEDDRPPSPVRNYRHIGAKPTSIPMTTINETWSPLPPPSISLATSLLRFAERPVLQSLSTNAKRRDHASFVLRKVCHTISRRLTRQFPFPPALGTSAGPRRQQQQQQPLRDPRDAELDYEHVLSTVKTLQGSLDALLHTNALLSSEKDREEALLEKEYAELDNLEANARSEVRGLREKLRKAHPLVPDPAPPQQRQHGVKEGLVDNKLSKEEPLTGPLFGDLAQVDLTGLDSQLANHMDSLKANLGQVEGVVPEVMQSRAALRNVLARHLAPGQLEDVILG